MAMSKITLGLLLVTIPAKLETATEKAESFTSLCVGQNGTAHDPTAITMPKTCASCGPVTDYKTLKKGLKTNGGFVVIEQDEIANAKAATDELYKGKVQLTPVLAEDFFADTAQGDKLYTVHVDAAAADQYALIAAAVDAHPEWAYISQYTPRSRAGLFVARVRNGVLMLEERVRHENLKPLPAPVGNADANMLGLLDQILPTMVTKFDPANYADKYAEQIKALAAARAATPGQVPAQTATPVATPSGGSDLLAKLQELAAASTKAPAA